MKKLMTVKLSRNHQRLRKIESEEQDNSGKDQRLKKTSNKKIEISEPHSLFQAQIVGALILVLSLHRPTSIVKLKMLSQMLQSKNLLLNPRR